MTITFNAIDVETANPDRSSICQIGIAHIENGKIVDQWESFIDPETWFDSSNILLHGISEDDVENSPTIPEVQDELRKRLHGSVLIHHSPFDKVALNRAMERYNLELLQVQWLDSVKIARRAWPEYKKDGGHGLENLARKRGISFKHHNALEDAIAAARIVLDACDVSKTDIPGWLERINQPTSSRRDKPKPIKLEGNIEGKLDGEAIVFTGTLEKLGMTRKEVAELAKCAGADVKTTISKQVTMLVVGTQDMRQLQGHQESRKHREAKELIEKGIDITIISEDDFIQLIQTE